MTADLEVLIYEAERHARFYGLPVELILTHALSLAAAMSRRVIRGADGPPVLPLLIRTAEAHPEWLELEWQAVETFMDLEAGNTLLQHPAAVAAARRRRRIQMLIDPDGVFLSTALNQHLAERTIRPLFGRLAISRSQARAVLPTGGQPLTHLAAKLPRVRTALRRVTANPEAESLIACMDGQDFKKLVRSEDPAELIRHVGLIISAPSSKVVEPLVVPPEPLAALIHTQFIRAAVTSGNKWVFSPGGQARSLLDDHRARVEQVLATLPPALRASAPDALRTWHMASVLALLSVGGGEQEEIDLQSSILAVKLADWGLAEHLRIARLAWPADDHRLFDGLDLQVFRQLTTSPQPARNLQRALKGVNNDRCLAALHRAVAAGLVVEQPVGRFALAVNPVVGLSDFSQQEPPLPTFASEMGGPDTDSTDKLTGGGQSPQTLATTNQPT